MGNLGLDAFFSGRQRSGEFSDACLGLPRAERRILNVLKGRFSLYMSPTEKNCGPELVRREPGRDRARVLAHDGRPRGPGASNRAEAPGPNTPRAAASPPRFSTTRPSPIARHSDAALPTCSPPMLRPVCWPFSAHPHAGLVRATKCRMLHVHPSLLPSFTRLNTHRLAIEAWLQYGRRTVHFFCADLGPRGPSSRSRDVRCCRRLTRHPGPTVGSPPSTCLEPLALGFGSSRRARLDKGLVTPWREAQGLLLNEVFSAPTARGGPTTFFPPPLQRRLRAVGFIQRQPAKDSCHASELPPASTTDLRARSASSTAGGVVVSNFFRKNRERALAVASSVPRRPTLCLRQRPVFQPLPKRQVRLMRRLAILAWQCNETLIRGGLGQHDTVAERRASIDRNSFSGSCAQLCPTTAWPAR